MHTDRVLPLLVHCWEMKKSFEIIVPQPHTACSGDKWQVIADDMEYIMISNCYSYSSWVAGQRSDHLNSIQLIIIAFEWEWNEEQEEEEKDDNGERSWHNNKIFTAKWACRIGAGE